ncbi:Hypothetical_protein [Hexamita inflata]|uniref:Hypothetical_protein n=1 Tax=Hexamita inflata TaxID=28002 RepID=A0AA86PVB0_9EUKA|nr:Hypothetical protein HINF_LOCUS32472 [Hexamita inflata]
MKYIDGFNKQYGVKQQFTIPKVFNVSRLTLYKCIVDLSSLQGYFGTIDINLCTIKGCLTENLFVDKFKVSIRETQDIKLSQLSKGRIKKIDLHIYNLDRELDLSGAKNMYGRLGYLYFSSSCKINLTKLEGFWDCVDISNCTLTNSTQSQIFGAKTLQIYQPSLDILKNIQNSNVTILELEFQQTQQQQNIDYNLLLQYQFVTTTNYYLFDFQIDLNQLKGNFHDLSFTRCSFQGNLSQNCMVDKLYINGCTINSQQLSQFSCNKLQLIQYDKIQYFTELPQQLQKIDAYGITINIKNSKQYPRLTEIELDECYVENHSFVNVPNIKSLKLDDCKPSKSTHDLQNIIKRKKKNDAKLVELKKELLLTKIQNQERRRKLGTLKTELTELLQLDVSQITVGQK